MSRDCIAQPIDTQRKIDSIAEDCVDRKPMVVVICITYNHASYIKDALDGFIMQQTNFPFVAIIHDDASTDGTDEILREYAAKYPDIIKPIYEEENQYSKRQGIVSRTMRTAIKATGAKYVAMCEGDDYWTDPLKLQKQVDFLESHPGYSMVFANARYVYEDGHTAIPHQLKNREYKPLEIYQTYLCPTPTVLHRAEVYKNPIFQKLTSIKKSVFGDLTLFLCCGLMGKIWGSNDIVCDYRRLSSGAANALNRQQYLRLRNHIILSKAFGNEFMEVDRERFENRFVGACFNLTENYPDNLLFVCRYIIFAPGRVLKRLKNAPGYIFRKLTGRF